MVLLNGDCLTLMSMMIPDKSVDMILTDIPYDGVNRTSNGLRNLNKGKADVITFDLGAFLRECARVCSGTVVVFCGKDQVSEIFGYFSSLNAGTVRQIVWQKSNPSPMNGQSVYLSGVENAIWFKRRGGGSFNAHCKNTVFKYPSGRNTYHPTQKPTALLEELIRDNSAEGDTVLDMCMGSGSTGVACVRTGRDFIGIELDENYYNVAKERIENERGFND